MLLGHFDGEVPVVGYVVYFSNGDFYLLDIMLDPIPHMYASVCGYNTAARQHVHEKRVGKMTDTILPQWSRFAPYDFTGCPAHADVTYNEDTGEVKRIVGCLEHNSECRSAIMKRIPAIPLHPHVVEVALKQLADSARYRV